MSREIIDRENSVFPSINSSSRGHESNGETTTKKKHTLGAELPMLSSSLGLTKRPKLLNSSSSRPVGAVTRSDNTDNNNPRVLRPLLTPSIEGSPYPYISASSSIETHLPSLPPISSTNASVATNHHKDGTSHHRRRPREEDTSRRPNGGILRDGERMETLFGLDDTSSAEYWRLCRIVTDAAIRTPQLHTTTTASTSKSAMEVELDAWRQILQLRTEYVESAIVEMTKRDTTASPATSAAMSASNDATSIRHRLGADLLRLHRRATSRFLCLLDPNYHTAASSSVSPQREKQQQPSSSSRVRDILLEIWLSFVRAQHKYGKVEDARWTLRQMQTLHLGTQCASYYLALASVAENAAGAQRALEIGLEQQAEPRSELQRALREKSTNTTTTRNAAIFTTTVSSSLRFASNETRIKETPISAAVVRSPTSDMSLDTDEGASIEGLAVAATSSNVPTPTASPVVLPNETQQPIRFHLAPLLPPLGSQKPSVNISSGTNRPPPSDMKSTISRPPQQLIIKSSPKTNASEDNKDAPRPIAAASLSTLSNQLGKSSPPVRAPAKDEKCDPAISSVKKALVGSTISNSGILRSSRQRPPLQLKSFGLGKAKRVDPSQSVHESESEDENESAALRRPIEKQRVDKTTTTTTTTTTTPPVKKPKLKQIDLAYMMNWDPNVRNSAAAAVTQSSGGAAPSPSHGGGDTGRVSQTPSVSYSTSSTSSTSHASSSHSKNNDVPDPKNPDNVKTPVTSHEVIQTTTPSAVIPVHPVKVVDDDGGRASSGVDNTCPPNLNSDFMSLVREENMIRVNRIPYMKLGRIGKGASCVVYSALSREKSVLAIKKVNLEGLSQKSIDVYSNEIALLQQLRGNPAIIQLHDSELDLERHALYLVMEQGEADLNYVLQRQSEGSAVQGENGLNMNFIRLTWQQMLIAVHSIHEERIIHGDLKPANFLFVRGSLKLIDFGIAKAIQTDDTTNIYRESQIGTPNYMSPEAILDIGTDENGHRMKCGRPSDVWSLGCILYQMIYGKPPFAEFTHLISKLKAITDPNHQIAYPRHVVDEAAMDAVRQCLHRQPLDRAPIVGPNGLLNEHAFLNARHRDSNR